MRLDQANLGHIKIIIPLPDLELNLKFCLFHVKYLIIKYFLDFFMFVSQKNTFLKNDFCVCFLYNIL